MFETAMVLVGLDRVNVFQQDNYFRGEMTLRDDEETVLVSKIDTLPQQPDTSCRRFSLRLQIKKLGAWQTLSLQGLRESVPFKG